MHDPADHLGPLGDQAALGGNGLQVQETFTKAWGDTIGEKQNNSIRIISHNIAGFPISRRKSANTPKEISIKELMNYSEADIALWQELNYNEKQISVTENMHERCKYWFDQLQTTVATNMHEEDNPKKFLSGGTAIWTVNAISSRAGDRIRDNKELGRWASIKINGEGDHCVRVFSVYCPTRNVDDFDSAHNQQLRYLLDNDDDRSPQEAWLNDLESAINEAINKGEKIIIGGDINTKADSTRIQDMLRRTTLTDVMLKKHNEQGPPTFINGNDKIDIMWASRDLNISACGYLDCKWCAGDHRVLWLDVTAASALGENIPRPRTKNARRLTLNDPRVVRRYVNNLKRIIKKSKLVSRLKELYKRMDIKEGMQPIDEALQREYEDIVDEFQAAMAQAEERCRRFRVGGVEFSPAINIARKSITYWWLMRRKALGRRVSRKRLDRLFQLGQVENNMTANPANLQLIEEQLKEAKKVYYGIAKAGDAKRTEHLWQIATANAEKKGTDIDKEFKSLTKAEDSRKMHRMIRLTKPQSTAKSITNVLAPDVNLPIEDEHGVVPISYSDKHEVERAFLQHLDRRFTQAHNTYPLSDEFIARYGLFGTTDEVEELLSGNFMHNDNSPESDLMNTFHGIPRPNKMKTIIQGRDFSALWKKVKEKTASCPLAHHFGHFKAIATDEYLSEAMAMLMTIPLAAGFSPTQYKKMTAVLLEKKKGDFRIEKLRIILLLDAMYSATLRILAKWVSGNAEATKRLAPEQSGSRKNMDAKAQAINLRLTMDLAILYKRPVAVICNDLQSCYDRMVHAFVGVALQSYGVPKSVINMKFGVAQDACINVRTGHGLSEMTNKAGIWNNVLDRVYHSVFQGSPDSPIQWAIVSSAVLEAYRRKGYGFKVHHPFNGMDLHIVAGLFVDDSTYFIATPSDNVNDVIDLSRQSQTYLEKLIAATGGAMNPSKSFWWLIDFQWEDGKWSWKTIDDNDAGIQIHNPLGNLEYLERLEVDSPQRLLGAQLCPKDDGSGTMEALLDKANKWAAVASNKKINPTFAWLGLKTGIMKGIEWPLAVANLSEGQCRKVMVPILKTGLRGSNIQWLIARKLVYGPEEYNGFGLHSIFIELGCGKITHLVSNIHRRSQFGDVLRMVLSCYQLVIGTSKLFLNVDFVPFKKALELTWITHLWMFARKNDIEFEYKIPDRKRRTNDRYLMDEFLRLGYRGVAIKYLIQCRMHLQVLTIADIADADGTRLCHDIEQHQKRTDIPSRFNWPNQPSPSARAWTIWDEAIKKITHMRLTRHLDDPVGEWIDNDKDRCEWFYSPHERRIYRRNEDVWEAYSHNGHANRPRSGTYTLTFLDAPAPDDLRRAAISRIGNSLRLRGYAADRPPPVTDVDNYNYHAVLKNATLDLAPTERYLLRQIEVKQGTFTGIARALRRKKLRMVSDGSYRPENGNSAFCLLVESKDRRHQVRVSYYVPGLREDNDAYRAECTGLWTGLLFLQCIEKTFKLTKGKVTMACDGKGALNRCTRTDWIAIPNEPHYDIMIGIEKCLPVIKATIKPRWVKGHRDDHVAFHLLNRYEQLNVLCDKRAKELSAHAYELHAVDIPGHMFVKIGGTRLTSSINKRIAHHILGSDAREYWAKKLDIDIDDLKKVEWTALGNARRGFPPNKAKWVTKFLSENLPTGKNMVKWGHRDSSKCPFCNQDDEDAEHVLRCQHADVRSQWDTALDKLALDLDKLSTAPTLRHAIITNLRTWSRGYEPQQLHGIADAQFDIGWHALVGGFWHKQWATIQHTHYQYLGLRNTGQVWLAKAIRLIWHVAWSIWEARNKRIHQDDVARLYENMEAVDLQIQTEFTLPPPNPCPSRYRHFFYNRDLNQILALPNYQRRKWSTAVQQAREACQRENVQAHALHAQQNLMLQWLQQPQQQPQASP